MSDGEAVAGALSALSAAVIAIAIAVIRTRERVAKIEEWVRLHDRDRDRAA